ncbi:hypothetical protein GMLC_16390 [Geomonas limicola]|uniref:Phosphatidic acid phosphatase type 2/haloperoxidase domain-containing protein n=1 Tax=Geomonas limicola TaxID=2740186 RepID=A0A6V8N6S9_9BACT|nr:phosphatase PAP2 family protein [Geomonas limicola]GFO68060.1 hypothetical protein GMLC_16390 [Geomonas limicola]
MNPAGVATPWLAGLVRVLLAALLVLLSVRWLDVPLALWVRDNLYTPGPWSRLTSDLPDLLLQVVIATSVLSLFCYRMRHKWRLDEPLSRLVLLNISLAPAAYLVKALAKMVFGRVNTRDWLQEPGLYGFHWFHPSLECQGFPSGHMVVLGALLAAVVRCYPRWRAGCTAVGVLLGGALVATDYHFLSDVLAGAVLGVLVERGVAVLVTRALRSESA